VHGMLFKEAMKMSRLDKRFRRYQLKSSEMCSTLVAEKFHTA
jgi:hypothetical protein